MGAFSFHRHTKPSSTHCRRHFGRNYYDSLTDAEDADEWLNAKLKKLRSKRELEPDVVRRKRQEKILLEVDQIDMEMILQELKHASDERNLAVCITSCWLCFCIRSGSTILC